MLARELALRALAHARRDARVELRYEPGGATPAAMAAWIDGRAVRPGDVGLPECAELRTAGVARRLIEGVRESLAEVARWGHFHAEAFVRAEVLHSLREVAVPV